MIPTADGEIRAENLVYYVWRPPNYSKDRGSRRPGSTGYCSVIVQLYSVTSVTSIVVEATSLPSTLLLA